MKRAKAYTLLWILVAIILTITAYALESKYPRLTHVSSWKCSHGSGGKVNRFITFYEDGTVQIPERDVCYRMFNIVDEPEEGVYILDDGHNTKASLIIKGDKIAFFTKEDVVIFTEKYIKD